MALQLAEGGVAIFLCKGVEEGMELKQIKRSAYLCGEIVGSKTAIARDVFIIFFKATKSISYLNLFPNGLV